MRWLRGSGEDPDMFLYEYSRDLNTSHLII
jgi:hypothetical protein